MAAEAAQSRIALIRHGQTEWAAIGRHTSVTDIDLTDHGVRQAAEIPALLEFLGIRAQTTLVSPRLRARRTAEIAGLDVTDIDDDLAEWFYGDYEGLKTPEIRAQDPHWRIFEHGAPGGESVEQVQTRVDRVLNRARTALALGDVVLVCHGHISRALAVSWADLPLSAGTSIALDPASATVLAEHNDEPIIQHANIFR